MKDFRRLYNRLDSTTSTNIKVDALADYFRETHPRNAAWGLHLLLGKRQKRVVTSRILRETFLINFSEVFHKINKETVFLKNISQSGLFSE